MKITIGELFDINWEKTCEVLGLDLWCLSEGKVDRDYLVRVTEDEMKKINNNNYYEI